MAHGIEVTQSDRDANVDRCGFLEKFSSELNGWLIQKSEISSPNVPFDKINRNLDRVAARRNSRKSIFWTLKSKLKSKYLLFIETDLTCCRDNQFSLEKLSNVIPSRLSSSSARELPIISHALESSLSLSLSLCVSRRDHWPCRVIHRAGIRLARFSRSPPPPSPRTPSPSLRIFVAGRRLASAGQKRGGAGGSGCNWQGRQMWRGGNWPWHVRSWTEGRMARVCPRQPRVIIRITSDGPISPPLSTHSFRYEG